MHKGYFGQPGAQIHYRACQSTGTEMHRPLLCLPPAPHSSLNYTEVMPLLAQNRQVLSVDYPGYGGSDPLDAAPTIESFAKSLSEFCFDRGPVDLLGFHSGCLVALELALQIPEMVGRIVLIDVPYFEAKTRESYMGSFPARTPFPQKVDDLAKGFETNVTKRVADLTLPRAYELWVETLRAGEEPNNTFRAAFSYDCEAKFADFERQVDVIATTGSLLEPSRTAAAVLPNSALYECLEIDRAVFEVGVEIIAEKVGKVLDA